MTLPLAIDIDIDEKVSAHGFSAVVTAITSSTFSRRTVRSRTAHACWGGVVSLYENVLPGFRPELTQRAKRLVYAKRMRTRPATLLGETCPVMSSRWAYRVR